MDTTPITIPLLSSSELRRIAAERADTQLSCDGCTSVGRTRKINEDQFAVSTFDRLTHLDLTSLPDEPRGAGADGIQLLVVADGMGGHHHGEVAATIAVETMIERVAEMPWRALDDGRRKLLTEELRNAFAEAESRVRERNGTSASGRPMGTTLTVALIRWPWLVIAHAGDSRLYRLRDGCLQQLTRDHTLASHLFERGVLDETQEKVSNVRHVLTNAIGGNDQEVEVDISVKEILDGDRILLCSDGVSGQLDPAELTRLLGGAGSAREACRWLVAAADEAGGRDNATAIVALSPGALDAPS